MIILERRRVGHYKKYALIIPDHASGRRDRYTVYLIPPNPSVSQSGGVRIIGRELSFGHSKEVAWRHLNAAAAKGVKQRKKDRINAKKWDTWEQEQEKELQERIKYERNK